MGNMEVVEAKEKVDQEKEAKVKEAKEKVDSEGRKNKKETLGEEKEPEKVATDDVNNKSGKIKRRGKKKSSTGEEEVNVESQKGGNPAKTSSQEATDTAIVKRMVGQLIL